MKRVLLLVLAVLALSLFWVGLGEFTTTANAGPIRNIIRWIIDRDPQPVPPEPTPDPDPNPDPAPKPDPDPKPVPPPPQTKLLVLFTGDGPRNIREMSPEGVATLFSRTVRDWCEAACEADGFRILPKALALADPRFASLASRAPDGKVVLIAKMPDKEPLVLDPVPLYSVAIEKISEYAGVNVSPRAARPPPLREFTAKEWAEYVGDNKAVIFDGKQRFLANKPRDVKKFPYGSAPGTKSLADSGVRIIPRSEWPARLASLRAANAGIRALTWDKLPCHDQSSTNYCWGNGPACCGSTILFMTGRGSYLLSAASVCGPITGYRNQGGWPADAIAFMAKKGAVRDSLWPNASIDSRYYNRADVQADYSKHLVSSTIVDLGSQNIFEETVTCVLLGCPVATAHNWWMHAVTATGLDYSDGVWFLEERNSWGMSYGQQGYFKLREGFGRNQAGPDDAQVILWIGEKPMTSAGPTVDVPVSVETVNPSCPDGTCPVGRSFGRRR